MVYEYEINGVKLKSGDLICTQDGADGEISGQVWRLIGKLLPGKVDHIVVYTGPGGRCIEAGAKMKVVEFKAPQKWDAYKLTGKRGPLIDTFYGIAYPLKSRGLSEEEENRIREKVVRYCEKQLGKPYNINFLNSSTTSSFYCSQLAYKAYLKQGIDLNTGKGVPRIPFTESIIFPQEIWSGCKHTRARQ